MFRLFSATRAEVMIWKSSGVCVGSYRFYRRNTSMKLSSRHCRDGLCPRSGARAGDVSVKSGGGHRQSAAAKSVHGVADIAPTSTYPSNSTFSSPFTTSPFTTFGGSHCSADRAATPIPHRHVCRAAGRTKVLVAAEDGSGQYPWCLPLVPVLRRRSIERPRPALGAAAAASKAVRRARRKRS